MQSESKHGEWEVKELAAHRHEFISVKKINKRIQIQNKSFSVCPVLESDSTWTQVQSLRGISSCPYSTGTCCKFIQSLQLTHCTILYSVTLCSWGLQHCLSVCTAVGSSSQLYFLDNLNHWPWKYRVNIFFDYLVIRIKIKKGHTLKTCLVGMSDNIDRQISSGPY